MTALDILYEDDALLFVNKPAGIVVQRGYDADEPVLLETAMLHTQPLFLMQRLDRGTSGVMFFSKLASINANLTRQFEQKRIRKRYVAICEGELGERQTIDAPLIRIGPISFGVGDGGKRAVTIVTPLRATPRGSLISIDLLTGRTHQIRVHLAAIGHPLAGDWLYGQRNEARPMLHARELSMTHPLRNEPLRVAAAVPDDFRDVAAARGIVSRGEDIMTLCESG
ncbi:MAG TPA: RluA family pseudouridine synthase [Thermoanaerobaculia bacterium]|nr:RluA family pseudouridine synthase [Thermoanaerobaculia bacterium]